MTAKFWQATGERAAKTFCQSLVAALGVGAVDIFSVGWKQALSVAATATVLSLLTSIGSAQVADSDSPSLVAGEKA